MTDLPACFDLFERSAVRNDGRACNFRMGDFPFRCDSEQLTCPGMLRDCFAHYRHDAGLCASIDNQRT